MERPQVCCSPQHRPVACSSTCTSRVHKLVPQAHAYPLPYHVTWWSGWTLLGRRTSFLNVSFFALFCAFWLWASSNVKRILLGISCPLRSSYCLGALICQLWWALETRWTPSRIKNDPSNARKGATLRSLPCSLWKASIFHPELVDSSNTHVRQTAARTSSSGLQEEPNAVICQYLPLRVTGVQGSHGLNCRACPSNHPRCEMTLTCSPSCVGHPLISYWVFLSRLSGVPMARGSKILRFGRSLDGELPIGVPSQVFWTCFFQRSPSSGRK